MSSKELTKVLRCSKEPKRANETAREIVEDIGKGTLVLAHPGLAAARMLLDGRVETRSDCVKYLASCKGRNRVLQNVKQSVIAITAVASLYVCMFVMDPHHWLLALTNS